MRISSLIVLFSIVTVFLLMVLLGGCSQFLAYTLGYKTLVVEPYVQQKLWAEEVVVSVRIHVYGPDGVVALDNIETAHDLLQEYFASYGLSEEQVISLQRGIDSVHSVGGEPFVAEKQGTIEYAITMEFTGSHPDFLRDLEVFLEDWEFLSTDYYYFEYLYDEGIIQELLIPALMEKGQRLAESIAKETGVSLGPLVKIKYGELSADKQAYLTSTRPYYFAGLQGMLEYSYR